MLARSWDRNSVRLSVRPSVCLSLRLSVTLVLCDETDAEVGLSFVIFAVLVLRVVLTRLCNV